jgi:hypothetical protein
MVDPTGLTPGSSGGVIPLEAWGGGPQRPITRAEARETIRTAVGIVDPGFWDVYEFHTGYDWANQRRMTGLERWATIGGILLPGASGNASRAGVRAAHRRCGVTVIGHWPGYDAFGERIQARYFNIPPEHWKKMSEVDQWAANVKFLDRTILRGDVVILSVPLSNIRSGSALEKEVAYLLQRGYRYDPKRNRLLPP